MTFFDELKRRRVVRVGLVYGAFAFAALQGADVLVEALGLPTWALRAMAIGLIVGFPAALALAWLFQITPAGVRKAADTRAEDAGRAAWLTPASMVAVAVLVLAGAAGGWMVRSLTGGSSGDALLAVGGPSIAVLPFNNLSGNPESDYFGDGLAEELLNALARIPDLKVAARTSAFAYRGRDVDVRVVGRDLGVRTVLEGSVRQSGDSVRIIARLYDTEEGIQVWSNDFGGRLDDVFAVQDSISRTIARSLEVTFTEDARRSIRQATTDDPLAHDAYLRGLYLFGLRGEVGMLGAIREFTQAVELDSTYAAAYAGLALTWWLAPFYTDSTTQEHAFRTAAAYAERALELGPELAEAHTAMALARVSASAKSSQSIGHYERAIALQPGYAPAHQWLGELLSDLGRHEEAIRLGRKAVELDPANIAALLDLGRDYWRARRYPEAIEWLAKSLELDPDFVKSIESLGLVYTWWERWEEGEEALRRAVALGGPDSEAALATALLYRARVESGEPQDVDWARLPGEERPAVRAAILAAAGRRDDAVAELRATLRAEFYYFEAGFNAPYWDFMRDDPEFQTLAARLMRL
ncbi:MAG: tetratricopeptide repeat protein [Gemmatimonadota bacterium]